MGVKVPGPPVPLSLDPLPTLRNDAALRMRSRDPWGQGSRQVNGLHFVSPGRRRKVNTAALTVTVGRALGTQYQPARIYGACASHAHLSPRDSQGTVGTR